MRVQQAQPTAFVRAQRILSWLQGILSVFLFVIAKRAGIFGTPSCLSAWHAMKKVSPGILNASRASHAIFQKLLWQGVGSAPSAKRDTIGKMRQSRPLKITVFDAARRAPVRRDSTVSHLMYLEAFFMSTCQHALLRLHGFLQMLHFITTQVQLTLPSRRHP